MKFGKEFKSQRIPEWEEAYMKYDYLKTLLKDIQDFNHKHKPHPTASTLKRTMTLYRSFSGLTRSRSRYNNFLTSPKEAAGGGGGDIEDQVILVTAAVDQNHHYETKFLKSSEKGSEYELVYFRRLDDEFNKVNKFYKSKVEEVMKEADLLNKQMDALIAFRIKVENPDGTNHHFVNWTVEMNELASGVAASAAAVSLTSPRVASPAAALTVSLPCPTATSRSNSRVSKEVPHMDAIKEIDQSEESGDDSVRNGVRFVNSTSSSTAVSGMKEKKMDVSRPASLEVLDRVTMNNTLETPRSTIKGMLNVNKNNEITFGRENLQKVEQQLQRAFVEFYSKLRLLKSYM